MTELQPVDSVSLEDVRTRFAQAETSLGRAARALNELRSSIESLDGAREALQDVGTALLHATTILEAATGSLRDHVTVLKEGVEALKRSEPAQLERRIIGVEQKLLGRLETSDVRVHDFIQALRDEQMEALGRQDVVLAQCVKLVQRTRLEVRFAIALIVIVVGVITAIAKWPK